MPQQNEDCDMKSGIAALYVSAAVLALSACVAEGPSDGKAPSNKPSDVTQASVNACVSAVNAQGSGGARVTNTEWSEANSLVMLRDSTNVGDWRCLVSNDAIVQEVTFSGDAPGNAMPDEFSAMEQPCIRQAARMSGLSAGSISILERIQTGGGPLLTLDAGGTKLSCRKEGDGSVTVFSEYAN